MNHHLHVSCIPRQGDTMILEKEIILIGMRGSRRCRALFDSGASYSIIRPDIAKSVETPRELPDPENWIFETAKAGQLLQATGRVSINFRFDDSNTRFSDEFIVLEESLEEVIIGATTMQKWSIKLDFESETIDYPKAAQRLRIV
jgi:hypothetical protein